MTRTQDLALISDAWLGLCQRRVDFIGRKLEVDIWAEMVDLHRQLFFHRQDWSQWSYADLSAGEKWDNRWVSA